MSDYRCLQLNVSAVDYFSLSSTVDVGVGDGGQMCVFIGSDETTDQNMLHRQK